MDKNKITNRKVDKIKVDKSKELLWQYMQSKRNSESTEKRKNENSLSLFDMLRNIFTPLKVSLGGVVAAVLIFILVLGPNLNLISRPDVVYASFEMVANEGDELGIDADTNFTLTASEDLDEDVIAELLELSPDVEFEVTKISAGKYEIDPVEDLDGSTVYNFTIAGQVKDENGELIEKEFSWAYQVKDEFKVMSTIPGDKSATVPVDTGIEIKFAHDDFDFEAAKDNFTISPNVDGRFEKYYRTLVFIPKELKSGTLYSVNLKAGIGLEDGSKQLEEDYFFQFETSSGGGGTYDAKKARIAGQYFQFANDSVIAMNISVGDISGFDAKMNVYKFNDKEAYLEAVNEKISIPSWTYYSASSHYFDKTDTEFLGEFEVIGDEVNYREYIYMPGETFDEGYYLFELEQEGYEEVSQALVQITDLAAYYNITSTNSILWVNDLDTGASAEELVVKIDGEKIEYEDVDDGVVLFSTLDKWKSKPGAETFYTEPSVLEIEDGKGKNLILEINSSSYERYGDKFWTSVNIDRPIYRQNDKLKFWAFIQAKDGIEQPEELKVKIRKNSVSYVDEKEFNLKGDFVDGEFELKNYLPGYYEIQFYSGDAMIVNEFFEVSNYTKPSYEIQVTPKKDYVFLDEKIEIELETKFFDGTPVPFAELQYYGNDGYKNVKTDKTGKAVLEFSPEDSKYCSDTYCPISQNFYLDFSPSLAEESAINGYAFVEIFNSKIKLGVETEVQDEIAMFDFTTHWIDLDRMNSGENTRFDDYLGAVAKNRIVEGEIVEVTYDQIDDGEYYDFISKKVIPKYRYERSEKLVKKFTVNTESDGTAEYEFSMEEDALYQVKLKTFDDDGNFSSSTRTVSNKLNRGFGDEALFVDVQSENDDGRSIFSLGDEVEVVFTKGDVPLDEQTEGKFMFIKLANGYLGHSLEDAPNSKFEFVEDYVPNVQIAGVWFDGFAYNLAYDAAVYFDTEDKRLSIEVETDKEEYEPGDEIEMSFMVKDKNGKPVETDLNLNLVDEALFKLVYDGNQDPLDDIYRFISSGSLVSGNTHITPLSRAEGDGGKGGCFVAGTEILMADGSIKAIEDIRIGDQILTKKKEYSSELVVGNVRKTLEHYVDGYLVINENLKITPEHILFVNNKWIMANEVRIGDNLLGKNGELVEVYSIEEAQESTMVYNFEVDEYHTYFANGFYVHNQKGGNDVRKDFEDTAAFLTLKTDKNGYAKTKFKLPDNVTSWRVMTTAIDKEELQAGYEIGAVKVSLPFFVDLVMNKSYSIKDEPIIKLRSYGEAVELDDLVNYVVAIAKLGLEESDVIEGEAFEGKYFELPDLKIGKFDIQLSGELEKSGSNNKFNDAILEEFEVVGSRFKENIFEHFSSINSSSEVGIKDNGYTELTFIDGGVSGEYLELMRMYFDSGERVDQKISRIIASNFALKYFDETWAIPEDAKNTLLRYQDSYDGGIMLLPYSEQDLELSALVSFVDKENEYFSSFDLNEYFYENLTNEEANFSEVVLALFGLASSGEPVLNALNEIKNEESLEVLDKIFIGLALSELGDKRGAQAYYKSKNIYNELSKGEFEHYILALGAVYAMEVDQFSDAEKLWDSADIKFSDDLFLERMGMALASLKNASTDDAEFVINYGEASENVELGKFGIYKALVDDDFDIEVKKGDLDVISRYENFVNPDEIDVDSRVGISRSYFVDGVQTNDFSEGDLVKVVLEVSAENSLLKTGFEITDILPSGLRVVTGYETNSRGGDTFVRPHGIEGQEVYFYWWRGEEATKSLEYYARVVSPGKYYADPSKIEASENPEIINIGGEDFVSIESLE